MTDTDKIRAPSKWIPEKDARILAVTGKLGEEAAELSKICHRIAIQGLNGIDPATGKPNVVALLEEIADVRALSDIAHDRFDIYGPEFRERVVRKIAQKEAWLELLKDE
jgi:hypothetical protein